MLMTLGNFVFELGTLAPNEINKTVNANWQSKNRYGGRPAVQFTGITGETVTLPGVLYPGSKITGTARHMQSLRELMTAGQDHVLVGGDGYVHGLFGIASISEKSSILDRDGRARKIEFEVSLIRTDDERTLRLETAQQ